MIALQGRPKVPKGRLLFRLGLCHARHFFRVKSCQLRYFRRMLPLLVYYRLAQAWDKGLRILRVYLQFCDESLKAAQKGGNLRSNFLGRHAQGSYQECRGTASQSRILPDTIENLGSKTATDSNEQGKSNRTQHQS